MDAATLDQEIALPDVISGRDELPAHVRVRIVLDSLRSLDDEAELTARGPASRCRLANVRIDGVGRARVAGEGDASGAQVLAWEVLASRAAGDDEVLPRVHDVVDEVPPDVDEAVARALSLDEDTATVGALAAAIEAATLDDVGTLADVRIALGLATAGDRASLPPPPQSIRIRTASIPPSRAPTRPPPPSIREATPLPSPFAESIPVGPTAASAEASGAARPRETVEARNDSAPPTRVDAPNELGDLERATARQPSSVEAPPATSAAAQTRAVAKPAPLSFDDDDLVPDSLSAWGFVSEPTKAPTTATLPSAPSFDPPSSERAWDDPEEQRTTGVVSRETSESPIPIVLVVKADEGDEGPLGRLVRDAGYRLVARRDNAGGFEAASELQPDVIVIDSDLPDESGEVLVRKIRDDQAMLSATPILLISAPVDARSRVSRFATGADVCLVKPYRSADVVAQVAALVKMSTRLRTAREALPYITSAGDRVFHGDLAQISLGAMLTILEMERRSGIFDVLSDQRRAQLEIVAGKVTNGVALDRPVGPLGALRAALRWTTGRFSFRTIPLRAPPPDAPTISALLGEALRLQDEEDHPEAMLRAKR